MLISIYGKGLVTSYKLETFLETSIIFSGKTFFQIYNYNITLDRQLYAGKVKVTGDELQASKLS